MQAADENADLKSLSEDLARASQSAEEPRAIALAFCTPAEGELRLTMQQWIDLEAVRSPLLRGEAFADADDIIVAGRVFGFDLQPETTSPEEAVARMEDMMKAVEDAFSTAMPMQPAQTAGLGGPDGFGTWLPVTTFLEVECGKSRYEARSYPVAEALALLAGARRNQGWEPKGENYAQRDVLKKEGADA